MRSLTPQESRLFKRNQTIWWISSLLVVKTKVASLKLISVPWFELYSALLAAHLLQRMADCLYFKDTLYAWNNASVILFWIKAHPSRWETFLGNRVAAIQDLVPTNCYSAMWLQILIQQILLHEEYWSTSSGKTRCGGEDCHSWEHWPLKIRFIRTYRRTPYVHYIGQ